MKMARSRVPLKRTLLLSAFVALSLFSASALAADTKTTDTGGKTTTTPAATQKTTTAAGKTTTTTPQASSTPAASSATSDAQTQKTSAANTDKTSASQGTTSSSPGTVVITPTGNTQSTDSTASMPAVTSSTSKLDLPTLSTTNTAVPTYPAPSVPPTKDAPFMQHSTLPDGTVFIAVGAILGGFAAALLLWRVIVAYLLHRSIARAAMEQHHANDKAPFATPGAALYKYSDRGSSLNVGAGGPGGPGGPGAGGASSTRGVRRTNRGPTPSATPSQTNLFFSPTAPGASGLGASGNRDSRLLPSGFYAAGSASPAGAAQGQAINMSTLRPDSRGRGRNVGPSPPDSPSFGPMRTNPVGRNMSGSSISLNRPASGRAPSAFLDDLLDDQPHLFPPGTGPSHPSHHHTYSQSSHGGSRY